MTNTSSLAPLRASLAAAALFAGLLAAQSKSEAPAFEVASIRPGNPEINRIGMQFTPGGMQASNVSLKFLIMMAYDVQPGQITGGPGWMDSERFNVTAKGPEGESLSPAERVALTRRRMQALLAERFQLAIKKETKDTQGYVLTVDKGGHKLKESASPESRGVRQTNRGELNGQGVNMDLISRTIGMQLGRKVVDETRLTGRYDITLNWTPQPGEGGGLGRPGPPPPEHAADAAGASGPTLFTAVREQLGLRLESRKVPSDLIVVEKAEKPSEN